MFGALKDILDVIKKQRQKTYHILTFDLSTARNNELINITGSHIYIMTATGTANVRLNENSEDAIDLIKGRQINGVFYRIFLSNSAQSGTSITLAIGVESDIFQMIDSVSAGTGGIILESTSPTIFNVTCTTVGTEYSQALGECRKFMIRPRTGNLQVCFVSGGSGTLFVSVPAGGAYFEDYIHPTALTLYFRNDAAGAIAEIIKWV